MVIFSLVGEGALPSYNIRAMRSIKRVDGSLTSRIAVAAALLAAGGCSGPALKTPGPAPDKNRKPSSASDRAAERLKRLFELGTQGVGRIEVRIVDAADEKVYAQVRVTNQVGMPEFPTAARAPDRVLVPRAGSRGVFWCYGGFSATCFIGPVTVEVDRGPLVRLQIVTVAVEAGKTTRLTIRASVEEPYDFRQRGWYAADLRVFGQSFQAMRAASPADEARPTSGHGRPPAADAWRAEIDRVAAAARAQGIDIVAATGPWYARSEGGGAWEPADPGDVAAACRDAGGPPVPTGGPDLLILPNTQWPNVPYYGRQWNLGVAD